MVSKVNIVLHTVNMSLKIIVAICLGLTTAAVSKRDNFFRRDYTYFEEYDAFYKLHWGDGENTWEEGFLTCDDEGAQLFHPADEEWRIAANMSDSLIDVEHVFVGIRDEFGLGDFMNCDGRFIPEFSIKTSNYQPEPKCGVMSVKTGIYDVGSCELRRPFICKKRNNEYCPTADSGYIFIKSLKKCFKVNENEKTWASAMHTCIMEGGVLSNSITQADKDTLKKLLIQEPRYFIGFKKISPTSDFYSSQGFKITSFNQNSNTNCVTFTINTANSDDTISNIIDTDDCDTHRPFICEMEATI